MPVPRANLRALPDNFDGMFQLMGLEPTLDLAALKKGYRKAALKYHPDKYDLYVKKIKAEKNEAKAEEAILPSPDDFGKAFNMIKPHYELIKFCLADEVLKAIEPKAQKVSDEEKASAEENDSDEEDEAEERKATPPFFDLWDARAKIIQEIIQALDPALSNISPETSTFLLDNMPDRAMSFSIQQIIKMKEEDRTSCIWIIAISGFFESSTIKPYWGIANNRWAIFVERGLLTDALWKAEFFRQGTANSLKKFIYYTYLAPFDSEQDLILNLLITSLEVSNVLIKLLIWGNISNMLIFSAAWELGANLQQAKCVTDFLKAIPTSTVRVIREPLDPLLTVLSLATRATCTVLSALIDLISEIVKRISEEVSALASLARDLGGSVLARFSMFSPRPPAADEAAPVLLLRCDPELWPDAVGMNI